MASGVRVGTRADGQKTRLRWNAVDQEKTHEKHRILVVDDEPNILNAVRRELMAPPFGRHQYEVEVFANPMEALARAREQVFEAVLADYRMPEMSGLDFLHALAQLQPDCARLVLSGHTDFDSLIRMINETHIYRFIPKPWHGYFLKSSLALAVDLRQATLAQRHQANLLREDGVELPADAVNEIDQILIVHDVPAVAHAIAESLTHSGRIDDVFGEVREHVRHAHVPRIDTARIKVQIADSLAQGLKIAADTRLSCVIAGYHMPGLDGASFLADLAQLQPDCACIMLAAEASMESVVQALDLAHISAFVAWPSSDFVLRAAVAEALAHRRLTLETRVLAEMCASRKLGAVD